MKIESFFIFEFSRQNNFLDLLFLINWNKISNIRQIEVSKNLSRIFWLFNCDTRYLNFRAKKEPKVNI